MDKQAEIIAAIRDIMVLQQSIANILVSLSSRAGVAVAREVEDLNNQVFVAESEISKLWKTNDD